MSASGSNPASMVTVGRKTYELAPKDLAAVKAAVAKAWAPILRGLRAQLSHAQALWTLHRDLREDSFLTARIVEAVARTGFPKQDMIRSADASLARLESAVARGEFAGIEGAYDQAYAAIRKAASAMQAYHEAICDGGEDCVKGLKAIGEASKFVLEVTADLATFGKPQLKAPMAAALGSYGELLTQIEAAQTSKTFDVGRAAGIVLAAGAREGCLKELMNDGQIGKIFVEKTGARFVKVLGKHYGDAAATKVLNKMFKSALEEGVTTSLRDMIKQCTGGKKLTLAEAAHHAIEEAAKKAGIAAFLGRFDKQLEELNDTVLHKIGNGTIKGLKVTDPKAARELKLLVEETAGKFAGKFLEQNAGQPSKLAAMSDLVAKQVLDDTAFKSAALKLGSQKAK